MLKTFASLLAFSVCFLSPSEALAALKSAKATITDVVVKRSASGVSIDMQFDRATAAKSLKPGYERNFIQFVLKSTQMDSARMIPVSESEVQKVFAYPYSRDTARVRVLFKKDNQWAKGRVSLWNNTAKSIRIFIKDPQSAPPATHETKKPLVVEDSGLEAKAAPKAPARLPAPTITEEKEAAHHDEAALLKEVISNTRDIDIHNPDSVKAALNTQAISATDKTKATAEPGELGTKIDPAKSFMRMAATLFGILALFIGCVLLVKRYAGQLKKLPFGKKERLIQVVATHYLGNKKSISLVKITGEYMVVGVSNEGVSLITKLGAEVNVEKYLEDRFWGGTFEKHLDSYAGDAKVGKEIDLADSLASAAPAPAVPIEALSKYDGPRDLAEKVSDKVELSPLRASIKEKLTKLKPLA